MDNLKLNDNEKLWKNLLKDIKEHIYFLNLLYERFSDCSNIVISEKSLFTFENLILSTAKTLKGIYLCLEEKIIADSYILLRKYRDDLLLYLIFKSEFDRKNKAFWAGETNSLYYTDLKKFLENKKLNIDMKSDFFKILNNKEFEDFNTIYDIENKYNKINLRLNNFVHSNGVSFINYDFCYYEKQNNLIECLSKEIIDYISFFTLLFISMFAIINPMNITSTDYIMSLELGERPSEESLFFVAPFVVEYFDKYQKIIGDDLTLFLNKKTSLDFSK